MYAEVEEQRVALQECTFLQRETLDDSARFLRILQVIPLPSDSDKGKTFELYGK